MKIGPLFIGWVALPEADRIELGLEPWLGGWETLCVEWRGHGFMVTARAKKRTTT